MFFFSDKKELTELRKTHMKDMSKTLISAEIEKVSRGGTPIWNGRVCSSEILNLTPKGDHLGVAQAFWDP